MFQEVAPLFEVDQWLRKLSHKALEGKADEAAQLELLLGILRDDLLPNQITVDRVDSDGLFVLPEPGSATLPRPLTHSEYETVIASRPDTILSTAAFGLQNTRSPRAVKGRAEYAKLNAKKRAGGTLGPEEQRQLEQRQLFGKKQRRGISDAPGTKAGTGQSSANLLSKKAS